MTPLWSNNRIGRALYDYHHSTLSYRLIALSLLPLLHIVPLDLSKHERWRSLPVLVSMTPSTAIDSQECYRFARKHYLLQRSHKCFFTLLIFKPTPLKKCTGSICVCMHSAVRFLPLPLTARPYTRAEPVTDIGKKAAHHPCHDDCGCELTYRK